MSPIPQYPQSARRRPARAFARLCLLAVLAAVLFAWRAAAPGHAAGAATHPRAFDVSFLTYNVCGLPDYITAERNLISPSSRRLRLIAERIKNYDIISLQEMFIPDREIIVSRLRNHFVARGTDSLRANPTGSGIYIFSKGTIQKSHFERWEKQYAVDMWSHKGFVGAETLLPNGQALHVWGLHAQAGETARSRIDNYRQLLDAVNRFSKGTGHPIVILGDFNCETGEEECTWLLKNSSLTHANPKLTGVDNIFYDENDSGWKISVASVRNVYGELIDGRRISDHLGIEAVLRFEQRGDKPPKTKNHKHIKP